MRRSLVLMLLAAVMLAACQAAPAPPAAPRAPADPAAAADAAFDFTATTLDGENVEGVSLQGDDLALWFWSPW